jgi:hypothetical protein
MRRGAAGGGHATDPVVAITGAWEEALDRLREADVEADPALTPLEIARAAPGATTATAGRPLLRIARAYTAARYGEHAVSSDDATSAWTSVDELEHALTDELSRPRRWRRRLDPTTLRR